MPRHGPRSSSPWSAPRERGTAAVVRRPARRLLRPLCRGAGPRGAAGGEPGARRAHGPRRVSLGHRGTGGAGRARGRAGAGRAADRRGRGSAGWPAAALDGAGRAVGAPRRADDPALRAGRDRRHQRRRGTPRRERVRSAHRRGAGDREDRVPPARRRRRGSDGPPAGPAGGVRPRHQPGRAANPHGADGGPAAHRRPRHGRGRPRGAVPRVAAARSAGSTRTSRAGECART